MATKWTDQQKQAINTCGKTLLVSAAAGSGKTATLTERIVTKLTAEKNPASISKMLIVTFTRLSAADLKRKISNAISEKLATNPTDKHLSKQLILLESAHICTIDSFYLDVVRSNFQRIGLPSNFRLADEGEMALLRKSVMDNVIEKHYDSNKESDDGFLAFVENFTSAKQSDTLSDIFLALENKLCSKTEGTRAILNFANELQNEANNEFFASRQGDLIREYVSNGIKHHFKAYEYCCDVISSCEKASESYLSVFAYEKDYLKKLATLLQEKNYTLAREYAITFEKQGLKRLGKEYQTDEIIACKSLREEATKFIKTINEKFFSFDENEIKNTMHKTADILHSLYTVLEEFEEDPSRIWNSNMFGKSLYELMNEGLHTKLEHIPDESRNKLSETLERIINEGSNGLICIIL